MAFQSAPQLQMQCSLAGPGAATDVGEVAPVPLTTNLSQHSAQMEPLQSHTSHLSVVDQAGGSGGIAGEDLASPGVSVGKRLRADSSVAGGEEASAKRTHLEHEEPSVVDMTAPSVLSWCQRGGRR
jgi:hypothetical protein